MARIDHQTVQIQAIESLLMSGDLFTYAGLSDHARRRFAVDEGKTGLVRKTINKLQAQGKLAVGLDGRLRVSSPDGGF